jgi:FdhD protein
MDDVAVEEPLEIRLAGVTVTVTMRSPGDDLDLAAGFLFTEGIISRSADIASLGHCPAEDRRAAGNIVNVTPADPSLVDPGRWDRYGPALSSCGMCGATSIEGIRKAFPPIRSSLRVSPDLLYRLPDLLQAEQAAFGRTGGLHAAALFDEEGRLLALREDIGRHNAVDKVIGHAIRHGGQSNPSFSFPLDRHILLVSGRISYEIVQKALAAGIPILAAVSAPSSLAVDLAREVDMTLAGFLRRQGGTGRCNVYTASRRIAGPGDGTDAALR